MDALKSPIFYTFWSSGNAHVHNAAMSFRIHHYIGSWETWRLRGTKEQFDERNRFKKGVVVDHTTPQFSSPENLTWLSQFVKLVGKEKALALTQIIRLGEELEAEKNFLKIKRLFLNEAEVLVGSHLGNSAVATPGTPIKH